MLRGGFGCSIEGRPVKRIAEPSQYLKLVEVKFVHIPKTVYIGIGAQICRLLIRKKARETIYIKPHLRLFNRKGGTRAIDCS